MSFILNKVGEGYMVQERELDIPAREQLAHLVWNALLTGQLKFGPGDTRMLGVEDWLDLLKWVYLRVDGQPQANLPEQSGTPLQQNVISVIVHNDEVSRIDVSTAGPAESGNGPSLIEG
jgi:hypothetical protein